MNMVIRDPDEMDRFAQEVENFQSNMRNHCSYLKGALGEAQPLMRDSQGQKAFQRIDELIEEMLKYLPEAEQLTLRLKKSASYLKEAQDIKF